MTARVLIIAEHDGQRLLEGTAKCVTCAVAVGAEAVDVAVFAGEERVGAIAAEAAATSGVNRVLAAEQSNPASSLAAVLAPQAAEIASRYTHVLAPSTTFGKDLLPRVAGLLGVGQISDIMSVEGAYRFKRPAYAGNAIQTLEAAADRIVLGTVRLASWAASPSRDQPAPIETVAPKSELPTHTRFVALKRERSERPDLQTATRVVAGGRAFGDAEHFALVQQLADCLGAAVGASRAAVDAGYASNDLQVGQTGKVIAPSLYVALGISGAIQHVTGIKDAGTIVAVNKDAEAPIFDIADIGLVADVFDAVPALIEVLRKRT